MGSRRRLSTNSGRHCSGFEIEESHLPLRYIWRNYAWNFHCQLPHWLRVVKKLACDRPDYCALGSVGVCGVFPLVGVRFAWLGTPDMGRNNRSGKTAFLEFLLPQLHRYVPAIYELCCDTIVMNVLQSPVIPPTESRHVMDDTFQLPDPRLRGIHEHHDRARWFLALTNQVKEPDQQFRLPVAALYFVTFRRSPTPPLICTGRRGRLWR